MTKYPGFDSVNITNDPTDILVYANNVTNGVMGPLILGSFFVVALLGTYFMQKGLTGRGRIANCFAAASFVSFGLSIFMSQKNGLLAPTWVFVSLALTILGALWLFFASEPSS